MVANLKTTSWTVENPSALVLGIHGLGAHGIWFERLATRLQKQNIAFHSFDLPGFGEDSDGHIDSFEHWQEECQNFYSEIKSQNPRKQIVVLGHSLGAVIASTLDLNKKDKLILSVPGFKGHPGKFNLWGFVIPSAVKYFFYHVFRLVGLITLFPKLGKIFYVDLPEPEEGSPTLNDPNRTEKVSSNLLFEILKLGNASKKNLGKITCPSLLIQVENDEVISNEAMNKCFELLGKEVQNTRKELYVVQNALHDWIWYDSVDPISQKIANWILKQ